MGSVRLVGGLGGGRIGEVVVVVGGWVGFGVGLRFWRWSGTWRMCL